MRRRAADWVGEDIDIVKTVVVVGNTKDMLYAVAVALQRLLLLY